jgi:tripartite-type tricarboxylate transporter receptor subunit TctC
MPFESLLCSRPSPSQVSSLQAAGYPDRPVKVIVPFPAGGVTDIATRVIAQRLSERLGQQFYVENIAGAGGNIGMADAAHAAGDGYTILFASSSIVVNPSLYKKIPFDVKNDHPGYQGGSPPNSWLVNRDFPAKTINELIALMKASPGKLSVASPGTGTTPSLSIELLKQELEVSFVTVPFAGGGPMTQSVLAGFTPIACAAIGNSVPLRREGSVRLRPRAISVWPPCPM